MIYLLYFRCVFDFLYESFLPRFGQRYVDRVANPKDIIYFQRRRVANAERQSSKTGLYNQANFTGNRKLPLRVKTWYISSTEDKFCPCSLLVHQVFPLNDCIYKVRIGHYFQILKLYLYSNGMIWFFNSCFFCGVDCGARFIL